MDVYQQAEPALCFGPFRIDVTRRCLLRDAVRVPLTPRLFELLLFLVRNAGHLVEKTALMQAVWGDRMVADASLSQAVFALRRVLREEGATEDYIITVPGRGYRFAELATTDLVLPAFAIPPEPARAAPPRRWGMLLAIAGLGLSVAVAAWLQLRRPFDPPAHSVAVLAFADMSGDPGQAYFADGLAEQLIDGLARVPGLKVAARTSSFSFKDGRATVGEIARALNVASVLEGSVRRQGGRIRVTAQLIDAHTGYQDWSHSYDRADGDILQVQADIGAAVTAALQVSLGGAARLTAGATANPAAMDDYLRGMQKMRSGEDRGFTDALVLLDQALAADPGFARADTGRAYALLNIAMMTADEPTARRGFAEARAAAGKAIAAAPDIASGHAALASVLDNGFLDPGGAVAEIRQALALEPGNATVQGNFAQIALDAGDAEAGVAAGQRATELDPLRPDVWSNLAYVLYEARRYDAALAALDHVRALTGALRARDYDLKARIEIAAGHPTAAARDCPHGTAQVHRCLAIAEQAMGNAAAARAELKAMQDAEGDAPYALAEIDAQWDDVAGASAALERAFAERDPALEQIVADPLLDPMHRAAAFADVKRKMSFPGP